MGEGCQQTHGGHSRRYRVIVTFSPRRGKGKHTQMDRGEAILR